jgi:hypothetical protein
MPKTAAATRTDLADTALSNRFTVKGAQNVQLNLVYDNVATAPELLFDALGAVFGTAATLTTALTGTNNDLTFTARKAGNLANSVTIAYVDPAANNQTLAVTVPTATSISVSLATGAGGAITSTAATVRDAINGHSGASALVFAANAAENDGTGTVTAMTATALTGGDSKVTAEGDTSARNNYRWRISA